MSMGVLFLDYDNADDSTPDPVEVGRRLKCAGYIVSAWDERVSPSGTGLHVRVSIRPEPPSMIEVVALQAICGSDPRREAYNIRRATMAGVIRGEEGDEGAKFWQDRWNVLYSFSKQEGGKKDG